MKKKLTLALAMCIALCSFAGCGQNNQETQTAAAAATTAASEATAAATTNAASEETSSAAEETSAPAEETSSAAEETSAAAAENGEETTAEAASEEAPAEAVEGTVLYDDNDIKITGTVFKNCDAYDDQPVLYLDIENNTGKQLSIYKQQCSMGGWMIEPDTLTIAEDGFLNVGGEFTVPAENDTNTYAIYVGDYLLDRYSYSKIPNLELSFEIIIGDDYENSIFTERVDVVNPDAADIVTEYDDSGDVAYDKDGVKIVLQGTDYDPDFWGPMVNLYAYNSTDKTIMIRIPQSSLDGNEVEAYGDMVITPGRHEKEEVLFGEADGIPPVSEVSMTFDIYEFDPRGDSTLIDTSEKCTAVYD